LGLPQGFIDGQPIAAELGIVVAETRVAVTYRFCGIAGFYAGSIGPPS
jgi:hypothetical protein